jgi:hypothetical protein
MDLVNDELNKPKAFFSPTIRRFTWPTAALIQNPSRLGRADQKTMRNTGSFARWNWGEMGGADGIAPMWMVISGRAQAGPARLRWVHIFSLTASGSD